MGKPPSTTGKASRVWRVLAANLDRCLPLAMLVVTAELWTGGLCEGRSCPPDRAHGNVVVPPTTLLGSVPEFCGHVIDKGGFVQRV